MDASVSDLLTPWFGLAAVLIPLIYIEKWIQSHLYGVGWLLTNDDKSATILYYILLAPGVFVHEVVQWLVAGAINVDTKSIRIWPEPQKDGTLRLDFVQIKETNRIAAAIIGAAPLVAGLALVWIISNYILNLDELIKAILDGDSGMMTTALRDLGSAPDFYLWLYLLFAISNAMLPTPADRQGWPLIIGAFSLVVIFLIIIGTGEQLLETYQESVVVGLERLTLAFATVLVIEFPAVLIIGFGEEVLERVTGRKFQYRPPVEDKPRQPGSAEPLPPGEPRPSIYALELPIPLPPDKPKPRHTAAPATARPAAARIPGSEEPNVPERSRPEPTAASEKRGTGDTTHYRPPSERTRTTEDTRPDTTQTERPSPYRRSERRTPGESPAAPTRATDDTGRYRRPSERTTPGTDRPDRSTEDTISPRRTPGESPAAPTRATDDTSRYRRPSERTTPGTDRPDRSTEDTISPRRTDERPSPYRRSERRTPGESPAGPTRATDDTGRYPRPSERTESGTDRPDRTGTRMPPARPQYSRPPGDAAPRSSRPPTPGDPANRWSRPPRRESPPITDDTVEEINDGDDVEYVPFDDIDIPDDDDL